MTRAEQYKQFNRMVSMLLQYAELRDVPIRLGEAHRPFFVARKYAREGTGIFLSKHRWSLAIDLWITDDTGRKILWRDTRYSILAEYWRLLGGIAGYYWHKPDPYHFEFQEPPA